MSKELEDLINKYNISVCDTDAILRFSSSKANNMYDIYKTFRCSLRGVRIKEFRPDIVELVWVGKDFDFNSKYLMEVLYSTIPNVLAWPTNSEITIDLIQRQKFIDDLRRGIEINTNTSK